MMTVSVINITGLLIDSCRLNESYNPNPGRVCPGDIFILIYYLVVFFCDRKSNMPSHFSIVYHFEFQ